MGRKLTYNPDKPTIGTQVGKPATTNEPTSSVFARMSGRPAPAASTPGDKPSTDTPTAKPAAGPKAADTPTAKPAGAPTATPAKQTFGQAFSAARKAAGGAGGKFSYGGKEYQTNVAGEKYSKAPKAVTAPTSTPADSAPATASSSVPTPPKRPQMGPEAPKSDAVPGSATGDVTPTAKPTAMAPDVGRSSSPSSSNAVTVAPEKSSTAPAPEKKKVPVDTSTTVTESVVMVGNYKYRIV